MNHPRKPYYYIFAGLLFIIMGFSKGGFIPPEIKIGSGFLAIIYGIYLLSKKSKLEN